MTAAAAPRNALTSLTEMSREIDGAVVLDEFGGLVDAAGLDDERAARVAATATSLLGTADERFDGGRAPLTQLTAEVGGGAVFVVRSGGRAIVAVTGPEPTTGLVFYDLKVTLRDLVEAGEAEAKPTRPAGKRAAAAEKPNAAAAEEKDG